MSRVDFRAVPSCGAIIDGKVCHQPMRHDGNVHERVQTDGERKRKYANLDPITARPEYCNRPTCQAEIKTMSFKGTGVCSTNCQKAKNGEKPVEVAKGAA